ncbi:MAG: hypothetical protein KDE58_14420, partial [Caldilineaceae bacterium]|nr:hypothetical protein [Caldilineaceae bacterium]
NFEHALLVQLGVNQEPSGWDRNQKRFSLVNSQMVSLLVSVRIYYSESEKDPWFRNRIFVKNPVSAARNII